MLNLTFLVTDCFPPDHTDSLSEINRQIDEYLAKEIKGKLPPNFTMLSLNEVKLGLNHLDVYLSVLILFYSDSPLDYTDISDQVNVRLEELEKSLDVISITPYKVEYII